MQAALPAIADVVVLATLVALAYFAKMIPPSGDLCSVIWFFALIFSVVWIAWRALR